MLTQGIPALLLRRVWLYGSVPGRLSLHRLMGLGCFQLGEIESEAATITHLWFFLCRPVFALASSSVLC